MCVICVKHDIFKSYGPMFVIRFIKVRKLKLFAVRLKVFLLEGERQVMKEKYLLVFVVKTVTAYYYLLSRRM